jgi:hypothetical protein
MSPGSDKNFPSKGRTMAKQTIVQLTDDISGGEAERTVEFAFAGTSYSLDLNAQNAAEFEEVLAPYIKAAEAAGTVQQASSGRRSSGRGAGTAPRGRSRSELDPRAVRAWAQENGIDVSPRGRIASSVVDRYRAAVS